MATLLVEALKGAQAEVAQQQGLFEQLKRAGKLTGILAQELRLAVSLSPFGVRAVRVRNALPTAGNTAAAAASPFGVVLYPGVPYGLLTRHKVDIYVLSHIYQQQQQQPQQRDTNVTHQKQQQEGPATQLPVAFFVHGGIWVTGERWHFCPMATRLAQAGLVVVVPSYTLYPDALAGQMASEVLAAYKWTATHIAAYGGDPAQITVMGHSAGGHLGSLALMMLAQQKHDAAHPQQPQAHDGVARRQQIQQQQQQQQVAGFPKVCLIAPAAASNGNSTSRNGSSSGGGSGGGNSSSSSRHLPGEQLRQRSELAAADAAHHHTIHPDQDPTMRKIQQQQQQAPQMQQQQQQQQQQGLHWTGTGSYLLSIPTPVAFIGMSSIYDVGRHFEFESLRGVAGISTMGRACGGAVNFDAISPAVILRQAAAAAGGAGGGQAAGDSDASSSSNSSSSRGASAGVLSPAVDSATTAAAAAGPTLLGEEIPYRSGLEGRHSAHGVGSRPAARSCARPDQQQQQQQQHQQPVPQPVSPRSSSSSSSASSRAAVDCPTSSVLASFSAAAAAQYMPPCILMSSLGDHMVPWHEAAEMFLALRSCSVPAKHLIYDRAQHNDFVLDWTPLKNISSAAAGAVDSSSSSSSSRSRNGERLPAFARDLVAVLTGRVEVQYETGSTSQTAAAVAALERAAGLPQMHGLGHGHHQHQQQQKLRPLAQQHQQSFVPGSAAAIGARDPVLGVPRPLSRL